MVLVAGIGNGVRELDLRIRRREFALGLGVPMYRQSPKFGMVSKKHTL
jgi:hypothetical protein